LLTTDAELVSAAEQVGFALAALRG
jgi:hypothetical protein